MFFYGIFDIKIDVIPAKKILKVNKEPISIERFQNWLRILIIIRLNTNIIWKKIGHQK